MELSRVAQVDGETIAWDVIGDGRPLVLVHGFPSSSHVWRKVAPALAAAGYAVYVYDLPGFGRSSRREGQEVWFDRQADVLAELLEIWGLVRPVVVAHDMGAGATVTMVARHRPAIERLVLVSAAVLEPVIAAATEHVAANLDAYRSMPAATWEAIVRARLATTTHVPMGPEALEPYVAAWIGSEGQASYLRVVEQIGEQRARAPQEALGELDVPTHVVWGEEDGWLAVEMASRARSMISNATLRLVPGAGHFLPEDAPAALVREVLMSTEDQRVQSTGG